MAEHPIDREMRRLAELEAAIESRRPIDFQRELDLLALDAVLDSAHYTREAVGRVNAADQAALGSSS